MSHSTNKKTSLFHKFSLQHIYVLVAVLILGISVFFAVKYKLFAIQKTPQAMDKTLLEQSWSLSEGALQDIPGNLYIWPYTDLRKQWYTFIWTPRWLQFWLYNFTYDDAKRFFHELGINGTNIQWIIEAEQFGGSGNQFADLKKWFSDNRNIEIQPDTRLGITFQHTKTFLADERFIIQTANITYSSFRRNRELFFFGTDTGVSLSLQNIFASDWRWGVLDASIIHPNIVICPLNCRQRIESLFQHAKESIYTYQQYIADPGIQRILIDKKKAWLDVKIILGKMPEGLEKNIENTQQEILEVLDTVGDDKDNANDIAQDSIDDNNANIEQEFFSVLKDDFLIQPSPYVHAKGILVDNTYLLVWSMNISATSLDKNREIWILLLGKYQIEKFFKTFMSDWNKKK